MNEEHQVKKGSIQTLMLAVLADGPQHGYVIAREIERRSKDVLRFGEGALYPALRSLESEGYIRGNWETPPSGPARRVYTITESGQAKLAQQVRAWQTFAEAVGNVIGGTPNAKPA